MPQKGDALNWLTRGRHTTETTHRTGDRRSWFVYAARFAPTAVASSIFHFFSDADKTLVDNEDAACETTVRLLLTVGSTAQERIIMIPLQPLYYWRIGTHQEVTSASNATKNVVRATWAVMDFDTVEGHDHDGIDSKVIPELADEDSDLVKVVVEAEDPVSQNRHGLREVGVVEQGYGNRNVATARNHAILAGRSDPEEALELTDRWTTEPVVGDKLRLTDFGDTEYVVLRVAHHGGDRYTVTVGTTEDRLEQAAKRRARRLQLMERYG